MNVAGTANVSSNANIGGNINVTGTVVSAGGSGGNLTGANVISANTGTFAANISAGNANVTSNANVGGNLNLTGAIVSAGGTGGNISGANVISANTGIFAANISAVGATFTGNANITGATIISSNATIGGNINVTGTVVSAGGSGGNLTGANVVSANTMTATTVITANANVSGNLNLSGAIVSAGGSGGNISGANVISANTFIAGSTSATATGSLASVNTFGFKNRLINGGMVIDQRNAGASVSGTTGVYTLDRWTVQNNSGAARFNVQQNANSVTPPAGYKYYLGVTSTAAYSVAASDVIGIQQFIEGYNIADLGWGASGAATITFSFWVRSSLTGTFGGNIIEGAAGTAFYPFTYTISAANTWEQKTVTIVGPTIGTWNSTNGRGPQVLFCLGIGSTYTGTANAWTSSAVYGPTGGTNLVATNAATFYITGVQFETGNQATPFDFRDYGRELILCQRYYSKTYEVTTAPGTITQVGPVYRTLDATQGFAALTWALPVTMRAQPATVSYAPSSGASGNFSSNYTGADVNVASVVAQTGTTSISYIVNAVSIGAQSYIKSHFTASAEL